jgi:hypothetical protein
MNKLLRNLKMADGVVIVGIARSSFGCGRTLKRA